MTFAYETYLDQFDQFKFEVDGFTNFVASQTIDTLTFFGYNAYQMANLKALSVKLFFNNIYIAQIIEGCNGLSVIILFSSIVVAFSGKLKQTVLFILIGSLLIHLLNVLRIAMLCVLIYNFPQQEEILHGVIFPMIIYGFVFMLWVVWVNKFSVYAKKSV